MLRSRRDFSDLHASTIGERTEGMYGFYRLFARSLCGWKEGVTLDKLDKQNIKYHVKFLLDNDSMDPSYSQTIVDTIMEKYSDRCSQIFSSSG